MTKDELLAKLAATSVHESCYSVGEIRGSECVSVVAEGGKWAIYYTERDKPERLATFNVDEDAYDFMYEIFCKGFGVKES
jgi:hypothetical protein